MLSRLFSRKKSQQDMPQIVLGGGNGGARRIAPSVRADEFEDEPPEADPGARRPAAARTAKRGPSDAVKALKAHHNTPPAINLAGAEAFAEIYGSSKVDAQRWFIGMVLCLILAMVSVGSYVYILPLKQVVPYIVEVNTESGVVNRPVEVRRQIDPNEAVVKSELARWIEAVYTIDPVRSSELLRWANGRTADKALAQFAEFRARERIFERISREPNMIREAKVTAVDVGQRGTAFIFVTTTERTGSVTPPPDKTKRYRVTLNFQLSPSSTESELMANPLGIFVTYFSEAEERSF